MSSLILRSLGSAKCRNRSAISTIGGKYYSTANTETAQLDDIVIPQRIHRTPTDILEALESTVGRDPTAPRYKYHDDPYLIPMSNYKKRIYALSQESGRKAALWIRQEHKDLFQFRVSDPPLKKLFPYENADPPIQSYIPQPVYDENSDVTEKDLAMAIENHFVNDAITIYNLLDSKSTEPLSQDMRQRFLELICFFNETEPLADEWLEEKWFQQGQIIHNRVKNWKNTGIAMSIFSSMESKTPSAYCAIIQGMCKHYQADEAYNLYAECRQNGTSLNVSTYNGLLTVVGFLKENNEMQWQLVIELLDDMKSQNLAPNLGTLNAVLESLSFMDAKFAQQYCTQVLAEFVNVCGIEPSLATWTHVLNIYYKERGSKSNVLYSIMDRIEGQSFKIKDQKDTHFFMIAMGVCRNLQDTKLCYRIQNLLLHGSNYDMIGDSFKENVYYRHFFSVISRNESLDNLMAQYDSLVPHIYVPEPSVMQEILRSVDLNVACDYYPVMWSHILMFGLVSRQPLVQFMLQSMIRNIPPEDTEKINDNTEATKPSLTSSTSDTTESLSALSTEENFARIAWDVWVKIEEKHENKPNFEYWTAGMLSDIILLLSRGGKIEDAYKIIQRLSKLGGSIGVPSSPDSLIYFAKSALKNGNPSFSTVALKYLSECGYPEASDAAIQLLQTMLNRPKSEVEELISEASKGDISMWTADSVVVKLVEIVNLERSPKSISKSDVTQESSESDSSSSDSEDEDDSPKK